MLFSVDEAYLQSAYAIWIVIYAIHGKVTFIALKKMDFLRVCMAESKDCPTYFCDCSVWDIKTCA